MISILAPNGKSQTEEQKDLRSLYLTRLHEIADDAGDRSRESVPPRTENTDGDGPALSSSVSPLPERATDEQTTELETTAPAADVEQAGNASSDEFRKLAEQIAPRCIEALTDAMEGMHRLAAGSHGNLEANINRMIANSDEIRLLNRELTSLRQGTDSWIEAERALSVKVAGLEVRLREEEETRQRTKATLQGLSTTQEQDREDQDLATSTFEEGLKQLGQRLGEHQDVIEKRVAEAMEKILPVSERLDTFARSLEAQVDATAGLNSVFSKLQETQQSLQKRMDIQAEAIRTLYTPEQERRNQLQAALGTVNEMAVGLLLPASLPEQL
jgi:chromosome segregation ATPase